jgi:hypothetical protein
MGIVIQKGRKGEIPIPCRSYYIWRIFKLAHFGIMIIEALAKHIYSTTLALDDSITAHTSNIKLPQYYNVE